MLTYSLDRDAGESLYIHLYRCIRDDILSGTLSPGTKLPSKRSFAKHLGVSVITIENAYAQLLSEGFLYSRPKSGFYVSSIELQSIPAQEAIKYSPPLPPISPVQDQIPEYSLVSNRTPAENFPFSIWARLMRETLSERRDALMDPSPAEGIPELRQAICNHLRQFRNMDLVPEQIIIGAGTEYLYSLLIQLLGYDRCYAVDTPGYQKLTRVYESHQVHVVQIPMDHAGIPVGLLEQRGADVAHISPSHHFPTGMVTPISRRYELLNWAYDQPDRYIIEDDYDSEFRLAGKPIPTLQSIDRHGRVIYLNTFTKTLSPTIRISYMVLPPQLLLAYNHKLGFYSCTVSTFEQYTLAAFIRGGHFERHINRMRTHYRTIRDALLSELRSSRLSTRIHISNSDSGLHFLATLDTDLSDLQLIARAEAQGLALSFLSQYATAQAPAPLHTLIVNFSGLREEDVEEVVRRLERIL